MLTAAAEFAPDDQVALFLALTAALSGIIIFVARAMARGRLLKREAVLIYAVVAAFAIYLFFLTAK